MPVRGGLAIHAFLFEKPILLIPALVVVQFILIIVWARRRTSRSRQVLLAGFVVFPLMMLIQTLVVTDREQLQAVCRAMADAIRQADVGTFADHLARDFKYDGPAMGRVLGADDTCTRLDDELNRFRIEEPRLWGFEIEVSGDRATVRFAARCRVVSAEQIEPSLRTDWELTFRRVDGEWQATSAHNLDVKPWF